MDEDLLSLLADPAPASEWAKTNADGLRDWYLTGVSTLARAALLRTIYALPWRRRIEMETLVPHIVDLAVQRVRDGEQDPLVLGNVDVILPVVHLGVEALCEVGVDVVRVQGRTADTILEFYEVVYTLRDDPMACEATRTLARQLFLD